MDWSQFSGVTLIAIVVGVFVARRVRRPWRTALFVLVGLLALRLLLWGNPFAWAFYERALRPQEVGWRQADVIREERLKFFDVESAPRYLAVGSSQTGAIYDGYAARNPELDSFVMAAMSPLDFVLYEDYIVRRRPRSVLLFLSEFDIAREIAPLAAATAPPQRLDPLPLWYTIDAFQAGEAYRTTMRELAIGELLPEYKYGFVLRGLGDKAIGRVAGRWGATPPPAERSTVDRRIEWLREAIIEEPIELNMALLRRFADRLAEDKIELIVVEGQYSPLVDTPRIERLAERVRGELKTLAAERGGVRFVPKATMSRLGEADFSDLSHVTPEAGVRFVEQLIGLLEGRPRTTVPVARDKPWWHERVRQLEKRLADTPRARLLFVGDSITAGWEREGAEVWQQSYAPHGAINFGISGDRTEHLLWRLERVEQSGFEPEVTVVLIGTNNTNANEFSVLEIVAGINAVVDATRRNWPETKVLLLALFPRGPAIDAQREKIDRINRAIAELHDGETVHYLDIGEVFVDGEGRVVEELMPDFLHLSTQGYERWAEAMAPVLNYEIVR